MERVSDKFVDSMCFKDLQEDQCLPETRMARDLRDARTALAVERKKVDNDMDYIQINNLASAENNQVLREVRRILAETAP